MLYTIGHSNHTLEHFLHLLSMYQVTAVVDVRSQPYSRYCEHFCREKLKASLAVHRMHYIFMGHEFGARCENEACYIDGQVQFDLVARQPEFLAGMQRIYTGLKKGYRIAFMCAEKEPLECHRTILVARAFFENGGDIGHIHADGTLEEHSELERRLLRLRKIPAGDMFNTKQQCLEEAYREQARSIAYVNNDVAEEISV